MGGLQFARNRTFEVARVVEIADDKEREIRELKVKIAALEANAVEKQERERECLKAASGGVRWRGVWWGGVRCGGGLEPDGLWALEWPVVRRSGVGVLGLKGVLGRTLGRRLGEALAQALGGGRLKEGGKGSWGERLGGAWARVLGRAPWRSLEGRTGLSGEGGAEVWSGDPEGRGWRPERRELG